MLSMHSYLLAHKKTVVIRPQMHNGFLPTIDIVAFRYVRASVELRVSANELAVKFGEPHQAKGLGDRQVAHKKSRQVGQVLDGLDQATEVASHDLGEWTSSMWMLIGVYLNRKDDSCGRR